MIASLLRKIILSEVEGILREVWDMDRTRDSNSFH